MTRAFAAACLLVVFFACARSSVPAAAPTARASGDVSPAASEIAQAPDRTDADRGLDAERHAAELLDFLRLTPGMRVAQLFAGAGYTAELLARAIAPDGVLYAENPKIVLRDGPTETAWRERLARPAMKNVVRIDREVADPLPPEANQLDLVVVVLAYHESVWLGVDRDKMNGAVFAALKHGGRYAIVDSSSRPGRGLADVRMLHRIEEQAVREEVERIGFRLQTKDSFLRNPSDSRDRSDSPGVPGRPGHGDQFALLFVKP